MLEDSPAYPSVQVKKVVDLNEWHLHLHKSRRAARLVADPRQRSRPSFAGSGPSESAQTRCRGQPARCSGAGACLCCSACGVTAPQSGPGSRILLA
eukprot:scaffold68994_cov28-Tisochrysis_lutea.AAC.8